MSRGAAALYSWTVVWRPQVASSAVPYAPAIVELDEGYHMVSNVIGCDSGELWSGMRLQVEFQPVGSAAPLPYFRPVAQPGRA